MAKLETLALNENITDEGIIELQNLRELSYKGDISASSMSNVRVQNSQGRVI